MSTLYSRLRELGYNPRTPSHCLQVAQVADELINKLEIEVMKLKRWRIEMDCTYTLGRVADVSGSHCPPDRPCQRCEYERKIDHLYTIIDSLRLSPALLVWSCGTFTPSYSSAILRSYAQQMHAGLCNPGLLTNFLA